MSGLINKNKCNLKTIMFNLKKMSINAQCAMNFPKLLRISFFIDWYLFTTFDNYRFSVII